MGLFDFVKRIFTRPTVTTREIAPTTSGIKVTDFTSGESVITETKTSPTGQTTVKRTVRSSGGGSVSSSREQQLVQATQELETIQAEKKFKQIEQNKLSTVEKRKFETELRNIQKRATERKFTRQFIRRDTRLPVRKPKRLPVRKPKIMIKELPPRKISRFRKKVILPTTKITGKDISKFIKKQTGFNLFEEERDKQEKKLQDKINKFGEERLDFYQNKLDKNLITESKANKKIQEDIDTEFNKLINKNEFFREKNQRKVTSNAVSFSYETDRLKAIEKGETKRASALLFLEIVADTPSDLIKLGSAGTRQAKKLFNDPVSREKSLQEIKKTFSIEKAKALPKQIEIKATQLKNFIFTSPTEALAIVGGSLVSFSLITKIGKPVLRLTGIISKKTSKQILKNLKFKPFVTPGIATIGKITVELSPKITKAVGRATRTTRPVSVTKKEIQALSRSISKTISQSKVAVKVKKTTKKLSKEQLRIRKRRIKKKAQRKIGSLQVSQKLIRKRKTAKRLAEQRKLKRRVLKKRRQKLKRRKALLKKLKAEKRLKKFKATKLGRVPKKVKRKVIRSKPVRKVKKITRKRKKLKIEAVQKKRILKKRKEIKARRKRLLREEKFRKSKLGILKRKASKKAKQLDKILKKFESPSGDLIRKSRKTPLKKTFPIEFKFKINDKAIENFIKRKVKGYDKLSGIDKQFLIEQFKLRIRNNPEKFISKTNRLAIQRVKGKKKITTTRRGITFTKIKPSKKIIITKIRPPKRVTPKPSGRQVLLQRQKLKTPKPLAVQLKIAPVKLNQTQRIALKRLKKSRTQQKTVGKQISVLKQKSRRKLTTKQRLRNRQQLKLNQRALSKLSSRSLLLSRQISKQLSRQTLKQSLKLNVKLTPKQISKLNSRLDQAVIQKVGLKVAQPTVTRLKITPSTKIVKKPVPLAIVRRKRLKKRKTITGNIGYNVFGKHKGKFIKINKKPLSKRDAQSRGSFAIDKSTSRTFKIKKVGQVKKLAKITKKERNYIRKARPKLRGFKTVKGKRVPLKNKFIEKRNFLIDSRGEKRQLSLARLIKKEGFLKPKKRRKK